MLPGRLSFLLITAALALLSSCDAFRFMPRFSDISTWYEKGGLSQSSATAAAAGHASAPVTAAIPTGTINERTMRQYGVRRNTALSAKKKNKASRQKRLEEDIRSITTSKDAAAEARRSSFSTFDDSNSSDSSSDATDETASGTDSELTVKLKAEAAAPFRLLRTFIYGAVGAAGGLGAVTNIPQLIFALQDPNGDKVTAVQNLVIDLGGVAAAAFLWNKERSNEQKQLSKFTEKQRRQDNRMAPAAMEQREKQLGMLPVEIQISEFDGNITRIVSLSDLQQRGRQNVVLVAGAFEFVRDAVLTARLTGSDLFATEETVIVPFIRNDRQLDEGKEKGFGTQESLMTAPYIAKPQQLDVWERILQNEVSQAEKEGAENVWQQGLVIALTKDGKVRRRGLGLPPWKELVAEMKNNKKQQVDK